MDRWFDVERIRYNRIYNIDIDYNLDSFIMHHNIRHCICQYVGIDWNHLVGFYDNFLLGDYGNFRFA